jgi:heptaprenyl diphosphate synthase
VNSIRLKKRLEHFKTARQAWYWRLFSGRDLFIAGLCIMPALLFNPNVWGRILQFLFFWALAALAGKKNNPLVTILVILGITAFNLLVPYGRVLFSLGAFSITSGALLAGLRRGVTLEGLFMLSRLTIRQDLRLPGSFGELAGESFRILALIIERKHRLRAHTIIADIDALLLELSAEVDEETRDTVSPAAAPGGKTGGKRSTVPGRIILAAALITAWLPWIFFQGE